MKEEIIMNLKKEMLIKSAARLYSIGVEVEGAKERIRKLVDMGTPYDSQEMIHAVKDYTELKSQWEELERQHVNFRDELLKTQD